MICEVDPALNQRWCYGMGYVGGTAPVIVCLVMALSPLSTTHDYNRF